METTKHAYLIICQHSDDNLKSLIKSIDDNRNDIYIIVDKKTKNFDFEKIKNTPVFSKVFFVNRIKITWGGFSLVKAELLLLNESTKQRYDYYHIMSGVDLCIKSQDYIHSFFSKNKGKNFITFCGKDWTDASLSRIKYYHLNCGRNTFLRKISSWLIKAQKLLKTNRLKKNDLVIKGGCQWCSLTHDAAVYVLSKEKLIDKMFSKGLATDELFVQTLIYNSPLKPTIYLYNDAEINDDTDSIMYEANSRLIDWTRGSPYTFTKEDKDMLLTSPYCFARKFSCSKDNLVELILEEISQI